MASRVPAGNNGGKFGFRRQENRITIELTSRSKQEMKAIKRKLVSELELVRRLVKNIEDFGSKPLNKLDMSVLENSKRASEKVEKDDRFYNKPDVLPVVKDRVPVTEGYKKSKTGGKKQDVVDAKFSNKVFKSCGALLEKLMKHKHGWVFNTPVDPLALGLHDYFDIIKHPMDLGTVKSRLEKNWYNSPMEFAEDVRLTFQNAMTYNLKGQDVHSMAELLFKLFEEKWKVIEADYLKESKRVGNINNDVGLPSSGSRQAPPQLLPVSSRVEAPAPAVDPKPQPKVVSHTSRTPSLKKPKARDPNKREMTYEEKQKLSINLQNLPSEKLDSVVKIIKKRTPSLSQKDDEIEVDIDTFDTETLWELDRFVAYYKKEVSKNKRKAEFTNEDTIDVEPDVQDNIQNLAPVVVDAPKEAETDERIASANSPIQMEKQVDVQVAHGHKSSSSSSSSSVSGSSSSDSDSDSSSAARSDAAHSSKA